MSGTDPMTAGFVLGGATPQPAASRSRPPLGTVGPIAWARRNLFAGWLSTAITLALGYVILHVLFGVLSWGVIHAVWAVPDKAPGIPDTSACQDAKGIGACWAVVGEKYRFILFGRYPYAEQWRPAICVVLFLGLYACSAMRFFWRTELIYLWLGTLTVIGGLMWGGFAGLKFVPQDTWGGPITLILSTFGLAFAFPLSVLVALGRRTKKLPAVKVLCILYVELIRGVPLISLLFMASVMIPLFLPDGVNFDKLLRAQIAFILFAAAYLAEVVRGGLQALPRGQYEAADALGLSYWQKTGKIILPQALRLVIPPLVNTFIGFFKDTSLVLIIGIFDLLSAGKVAIAEPAWASFSTEIYVVLALMYFVFCYAMSSYSRGLERSYASAANR